MECHYSSTLPLTKTSFDGAVQCVIWGWTMMAAMLAVQCYWVDEYAEGDNAMKWGSMKVWVAYLILQLVCIAYSWVACTYLFPRFPTIKGIPYFLLAFGTALLICLIPFCTDFGKQFAASALIWVLTLWSGVRLVFESIVQCHATFGVKGVSYWLLLPIQKAPAPYTMTYPFVGWKVTHTHGGKTWTPPPAFASACRLRSSAGL